MRPSLRCVAAASVAAAVLVVAAAWRLVSRGGGFSLLLPAPPHAIDARPRTLLIVQGAWRSFDRVVDGVLANLVAPNEPCDVVLSLDWLRAEDDTRAVLAKLRPHVVAVLYPSDARDSPRFERAKEFAQVQRALDHVDVSAYAYVMKTRTDLAVMVPFDFATAAGRSARFPRAFARFVAALRAIAVPPVRPCEALSVWVYSFGVDVYVEEARNVTTRVLPYSPVTNADITPGLQRRQRAVRRAPRHVPRGQHVA